MKHTDKIEAPCRDDHKKFLSPNKADHFEARTRCVAVDSEGRVRLGRDAQPIPVCPLFDWCYKEREHAQELFGRTSIEGTWHGELFVDGVLSAKGRKTRAVAGA